MTNKGTQFGSEKTKTLIYEKLTVAKLSIYEYFLL